jgi:hypothetical protein
MNLDIKEEMENMREDALFKNEQLLKLEKRNESLQQEVRSTNIFIF